MQCEASKEVEMALAMEAATVEDLGAEESEELARHPSGYSRYSE